jgi:hypothetical protein
VIAARLAVVKTQPRVTSPQVIWQSAMVNFCDEAAAACNNSQQTTLSAHAGERAGEAWAVRRGHTISAKFRPGLGIRLRT